MFVSRARPPMTSSPSRFCTYEVQQMITSTTTTTTTNTISPPNRLNNYHIQRLRQLRLCYGQRLPKTSLQQFLPNIGHRPTLHLPPAFRFFPAPCNALVYRPCWSRQPFHQHRAQQVYNAPARNEFYPKIYRIMLLKLANLQLRRVCFACHMKDKSNVQPSFFNVMTSVKES